MLVFCPPCFCHQDLRLRLSDTSCPGSPAHRRQFKGHLSHVKGQAKPSQYTIPIVCKHAERQKHTCVYMIHGNTFISLSPSLCPVGSVSGPLTDRAGLGGSLVSVGLSESPNIFTLLPGTAGRPGNDRAPEPARPMAEALAELGLGSPADLLLAKARHAATPRAGRGASPLWEDVAVWVRVGNCMNTASQGRSWSSRLCLTPFLLVLLRRCGPECGGADRLTEHAPKAPDILAGDLGPIFMWS